jgi:hypothetical protein
MSWNLPDEIVLKRHLKKGEQFHVLNISPLDGLPSKDAVPPKCLPMN